MHDLSETEKELLFRIKNKPALRPLFFKKAKGLKWFHPLQEEGYFKPEEMPPPKPSEQEGYITIPSWEVVDYLVKTAPELTSKEGVPYQKKFLSIMEDATKYAEENGFSNHQVWWRFAEILFYISHDLISAKTIEVVGYWLEDKYDFSLVADSIGEKLLPKILKKQDDRASYIARRLLTKLFRVSFKSYSNTTSEARQKACLQFDSYWAKKIIESVASKAGERLRKRGIAVFHIGLTCVLKRLKKDKWSSLWQPAIADHEQNSFRNNAENMFVLGYRNSLTGFIQSSPGEAKKCLQNLLNSKYETIQRIAIHCIGQEGELYKDLWDSVIRREFFQDNFRHETWCFLNLNYPLFTRKQKEKALQIIEEKNRKDENKNILKKASAYIRSIWLAAIKDFGKKERELYQKEIKTAGTEPEHPDFSSYITVGRGSIEPVNFLYTKDELNGMKIFELVEVLKSSSDLSQIFESAVISNPLRYFEHLDKFKDLKLTYVHSVISAYGKRWRERANLPWDDIWFYLLEYISDVTGQKKFWNADSIDVGNQGEYVVERDKVVMATADLIKSGSQSDDHAFNKKHHYKVKDILECLLKNQKSVSFQKNGMFDNALTTAMGSPRGRCVEALINVALRHCRVADKEITKGHTEAWQEFQRYFDRELKRKSEINYEFFALFPKYIRNFLYMSEGWLTKNLKVIFNPNYKEKWLCVVQGYAYTTGFVPKVYQYLKSHEYIILALDDKNLSQEHSMKFVQDIVYSFLRNEESLNDKDSLMRKLLSRGKTNEIHEIIQFIYSFELEYREKISPKVYELWPPIQEIIKKNFEFRPEDGRKLASLLCFWIEFIDYLNDEKKEWLLEIAPYASSEYDFSYEFLKNLARLSEQQPFEVNEIWQAMINEISIDTYKFLVAEEYMKTMLKNLLSKGKEGEKLARETTDKFVRKGAFQLSDILSEIQNQ